MSAVRLDSAWIAANPMPVHGAGTTKDGRGHVVAIGGARAVPGAPLLVAEAAFRAGAGKVQIATVRSAALGIGIACPEAGIIGLSEDEDGEIAPAVTTALARALERCDAIVIGPGMDFTADVAALTLAVSSSAPDVALVLDAAAIRAEAIEQDRAGVLLLTPNYRELAQLLDWAEDRIGDDPEAAACTAANRFLALVILKGSDTFIASPTAATLYYPGGGVGLATGGSGDVLAGALAGLLSRGTPPVVAAGWAVWLHGQAARRLAADPGPVGFLARELPGQFPRLLPQ